MADPAAKHTLDKLLAGENKGVFPPEVIENIWTQAYKGSVMQSIAQTPPIPLSGAALPVPVGQPTAGVVAEGGDKPAVEVSFSTKTIKPIKVAAGVVLSEEVVRRSPVMAYLSLQKKLSESIARAMDNAILHGKDALTGTVLAGQTPIISANANLVDVDYAAVKGSGLLDAVLKGVDAVEGANDDFTVDAFLARKNVRTKILGVTDTQGRPLYQASTNLADPVGQFLGRSTSASPWAATRRPRSRRPAPSWSLVLSRTIWSSVTSLTSRCVRPTSTRSAWSCSAPT